IGGKSPEGLSTPQNIATITQKKHSSHASQIPSTNQFPSRH
ncbi:hypothetical protein TNCV_3270821, partial [Trichonephila clavipes]